MGFYLRRILLSQLALFVAFLVHSQGLPNGWEYSATPSTHIISFPLSSEPNINGFPLLPGDYIGVFFVDGNGELKCGGATEWLGDQNTGIIAFGNDPFTTEKDGFASNETIHFRYFSWAVQKEYDASVVCNPDLPVTCSQFVANGLSGVQSSFAEGFYITVEANDEFICAGDQTQLFANPSGGNGNYSFIWTSIPGGFNSVQQNPFTSPLISTLYSVTVSDTDETLSADIFVEVTQPPIANAGSEQTLCETGFAQLNGSQSNGSGFNWITSGDGTFENIASLEPLYYPGSSDITTGAVSITLIVLPVSPCETPSESTLILQIINLPEIDAGADQQVCESDEVAVAATVLNAIQVEWTTTGDGVFDDPQQQETVYIPGVDDLQSGQVTLSVSASAINPCFGQADDSLIVEFSSLPEAYAGEDQLICEDDQVFVEGTVLNADTFLWITAGDGTFSDPGSLSQFYSPGTEDISNGLVTLQLIAEPILPCVLQVFDELDVIITSYPQLMAGNDATICQGSSYQISASASGYDDLFWLTSGDGTFSDPFSLNTLYFPGQTDIQNEGVALSLVAQPQFPCTQDVEDGFYLGVQPLPYVNAGTDNTICIDSNVQLDGQFENCQAILWSTLGDGTFDDASISNPIYFPGIDDLQAGFVTLEMLGEPFQPCIETIDDQTEITFQELPLAFAGEDVTIQSDDFLQLSGQAENYSLIIWATSGDGTFNFFDILNPVYTPGDEDITNEGATLSLTAFPFSPCLISDIDELVLSIDTVTSVNEIYQNPYFVVFPNPSSNYITIKSEKFSIGTKVMIEVFNDEGTSVLRENILVKSNEIQKDISSLASGVYYLQVATINNKYSQKLIVTR